MRHSPQNDQIICTHLYQKACMIRLSMINLFALCEYINLFIKLKLKAWQQSTDQPKTLLSRLMSVELFAQSLRPDPSYRKYAVFPFYKISQIFLRFSDSLIPANPPTGAGGGGGILRLSAPIPRQTLASLYTPFVSNRV